MNRLLLAAATLVVSGATAPALPQEPGLRRPSIVAPPEETSVEALATLDRAVAWLLTNQNEDGSWSLPVLDHIGDSGFALESYYAWQMAASALACMALREAPETEERLAALHRGLVWLTTADVPVRGSDWDVDSNWAVFYGFVCCVEARGDERLAEHHAALEERGMRFYKDLARRQTPDGGWAYYDDPPFSESTTWATSFCTALVLPALHAARTEHGWDIEPSRIERAERLLVRCHLPNGAFAYSYRVLPGRWTGDSIDAVKGSLGRIQVGHWALAANPKLAVDEERVRWGLEQFFEHHAFLDQARMRPIPHEGFYANAGYFYFFGHYYAAQAIGLLPAEERETWHRRLRGHLSKTQAKDGSVSDFLSSSYLETASTSYLVLALAKGVSGGSGD